MHSVWLFLVLAALVQQTDALRGPGRIGARVADFTLCDHRGQAYRLGDTTDRKLIVVVFLGVDCPLARLYGPRLAELARAYEGRGVAVLGIHANAHESPADLSRYAREHQIGFPLLYDPGNIVADRFG